MDNKITIYQKPTCSKCREALAILSESGQAFESINYYNDRLTVEVLRELVRKLGIPVRGLLRDEPLARGTESASDDELLRLMAENPDLIQRPIVVRGDSAVLGRPPEGIKRLLGE